MSVQFNISVDSTSRGRGLNSPIPSSSAKTCRRELGQLQCQAKISYLEKRRRSTVSAIKRRGTLEPDQKKSYASGQSVNACMILLFAYELDIPVKFLSHMTIFVPGEFFNKNKTFKVHTRKESTAGEQQTVTNFVSLK